MFTRLEAEAIGVLILLAIACLWIGFHDANVKREALAPVHAAQEAASAAAAIKAAQVTADQKGNLREAAAQNFARELDARDLAAVVRGLHDDAVRPRTPTQGAAAAAGSPSGLGADVVSGELYRATAAALADTADDAASLAGYADGLRTSGQLCARDYDSTR